MTLVAGGDPTAFEIVLERHMDSVFSLAYRIVGRRQLAEEVSQDALLAIWRGASRYDQTRASVRTWVLGIVHNRAIDALRRVAPHDARRAGDEGLAERLPSPSRPDVEVERLDEAHELRGALERLPGEQRRVIELSYYGGFTHTEVAAMLDIPLGTVKGRMRLGLEKLREQMTGKELLR